MKFTHRKRHFEIIGYTRNDHISRIIQNTKNFYEQDLLEYIRCMVGNVSSNTVALDVGANIGNHSIYFMSFVAGTVISIEPNPKVLPMLRKNLESNSGKWLIIDSAVSNNRGQGQIIEPPGSCENIGMVRVDDRQSEHPDVEITTIDSIVANYSEKVDKQIIVIKADIEGMELLALNGAITTLTQYNPDLFIEAQDSAALAALDDFLTPLGYRRIAEWGATPVYHFTAKFYAFQRLRALAYKACCRWKSLWKRSAKMLFSTSSVS